MHRIHHLIHHRAPRPGRTRAAWSVWSVWSVWGTGLALALLALGGCASSATTSTPTPATSPSAGASPGTTPTSRTTPTPSATPSSGYPVLVYFSKHPESDSNPLTVVAVNRVSPTSGVATYAIQQLIAGPRPSEASAGYYTELTAALGGPSSCGGADFQITLDMRGSTPEQGTATLRFCRATSLPGDLSGARIQAQIDRTLQQFSTIQRDVILDRSGHCFNDLSGMDRCLS
ncbi:MAG TPA: hypothetical protein VFY89_04175 [Ktedonobacterales bacterium]